VPSAAIDSVSPDTPFFAGRWVVGLLIFCVAASFLGFLAVIYYYSFPAGAVLIQASSDWDGSVVRLESAELEKHEVVLNAENNYSAFLSLRGGRYTVQVLRNGELALPVISGELRVGDRAVCRLPATRPAERVP
jgi:hypothetical protein